MASSFDTRIAKLKRKLTVERLAAIEGKRPDDPVLTRRQRDRLVNALIELRRRVSAGKKGAKEASRMRTLENKRIKRARERERYRSKGWAIPEHMSEAYDPIVRRG